MRRATITKPRTTAMASSLAIAIGPAWSELKDRMLALIEVELGEKEVALTGCRDAVENNEFGANSLKIIYNEVGNSIGCIRKVAKDFSTFIDKSMEELNEKSEALFMDLEEGKAVVAARERKRQREAAAVENAETASPSKRPSTESTTSTESEYQPPTKIENIGKRRGITKKNLQERLPHKCLICHHRFPDFSTFKTHKEAHENELVIEPPILSNTMSYSATQELSLFCAVCDRNFTVDVDINTQLPAVKACNICCYFYKASKESTFRCLKNGDCPIDNCLLNDPCKSCWLQKCRDVMGAYGQPITIWLQTISCNDNQPGKHSGYQQSKPKNNEAIKRSNFGTRFLELRREVNVLTEKDLGGFANFSEKRNPSKLSRTKRKRNLQKMNGFSNECENDSFDFGA